MKNVLLILVFVLSLVLFAGRAHAQSDGMAWEECEVKLAGGGKTAARCTTITVPENRSDPASRAVTLPLTRVPATGAAPTEPIFYLAGGPGMSNLRFRPPAALLADHDLIMVGYRGIDGSVHLDCPEVAEAMKGVGDDLLAAPSLANMQTAIGDCNQRLRAEGVDIDGYTILEVAEDMEAARQALGYGRIHLLSESYGTRVAQMVALLYPENVLRSAMIGVNPPGRFVWEPEMIDAQLAQYTALGQEAGLPDLAGTLRQVNADMPERWLFLKIDPGKVKSVAFALLFHRNTASQVFDAYLAAADGDASGLALMSLAYDFVLPNMSVWGEFLAKGFSADFDPQRDYTTLSAPDSVMGSPIAEIIWPTATEWEMVTIPPEYQQVQPSEVDTLLISGNLDFSTPGEYATDDLLPELANGRQLILSDMGHTADFWGQQPEAAVTLLQQYFSDGTVDETLFSYQPMTFDPGLFNFPLLAKLVVLLPLLLIGLLTVGIGRRVAKRRAGA